MIKIKRDNLEELAKKHYEKLKDKIKNFPMCKYSLEEIIKAKPKELHLIAMEYKSDTKFDFMKPLYKNFTTKKEEYDAYDLARDLKVDVCPYCNRNYTFTVKSENGSSRPQFDHFYDKDTYPILALSFYNLIPSCPTCNTTMKGTKQFSIYTHLHPYQESFNNYAKFKFTPIDCNFYFDSQAIKLQLKTTDKRAENMKKSFALEELYQNHKDIVIELIQKEYIYNESYINEIFKNFEGRLFTNREDLLRLVTCGYVEDKDLDKRPLSKLIKDISEELGLV